MFIRAAVLAAVRLHPDLIISCHVNLGPVAAISSALARCAFLQTIYGMEIWSGLSPARVHALRRASLIVADCEHSGREAVRLGLVRIKPRVVWDCVDLSRYRAAPPNQGVLAKYDVPDTGRFRVLFLGRLNADTRYKGTERVLDVLSQLPPSVELVFAGGGNDRHHLGSVANAMGLAERVHFTGAIEESDLPDIYRSADVLYLTSQTGPFMGEGIPLAPIEAMACGVPVIVGNRDGSRELLCEGGGHCGDPFDLDSQASYIRRLLLDEHFAGEERRLAQERAQAAFGYPAFAVKTIEAVESAVHCYARQHRKR